MPPIQQQPTSRVAASLSGTKYNSWLFSPWICELQQASMRAFSDLANQLIEHLEVASDVYSFLPESQFTESFVESKKRLELAKPEKVQVRVVHSPPQ